MSLPGRHNAENAALAVAMCEVLGADLDRVAVLLSSVNVDRGFIDFALA